MDDLSLALGLFKRMGCDEGVNKCLADMGIRFYLTGDFIKAEKVFTQLTQNARLEPLARLSNRFVVDSASVDRPHRYVRELLAVASRLARSYK